MASKVPNAAFEVEQADLLHGVGAIAGILDLTERQARHHVAEGRIQTFRLGARICGRRSSLLRWLEAQETS